MLKTIRQDFPVLQTKINGKPLIYFDSAATTHKPHSVIDTLTQFYQNEYGTVHRAIYHLSTQATEKYNQVRAQIAFFLNAKSANEIVFTKGTTEAINLVAQGLALQPGDEVIISEMEHHSNIVPWQMACKRAGAHLKIIPVSDTAELDLSVFESLLNERTKIVAIAHIANSTGTVNPIKTLIEKAHGFGAKVLIDAAQSVAHVPLDVQDLDADFLAFSGHKMFGPTGIGVLYGKYALLEALPPLYGGGDMIETVTLTETTYAKPPLKFEAGTPSIAQVMGLGAAVAYIQSLGLEEIHAWEQELLQYASNQLEAIDGIRFIGTAKEKGAIISFVIEGVHHLDLATLLDLEGIALRTGHHCAQPLMARFGVSGTNRISFCPFNTKEEIETFVAALNGAIPSLRC